MPNALIVEDDVQTLRLYTKTLMKAGYETYGATNLAQAREFLQQMQFDIVLCDMRLDGEEGIELLEERMNEFSETNTRVVVISAENQYKISCEQLGVDMFVSKPLPPSALLNIIRSITKT